LERLRLHSKDTLNANDALLVHDASGDGCALGGRIATSVLEIVKEVLTLSDGSYATTSNGRRSS
jgi:hypothetical protein